MSARIAVTLLIGVIAAGVVLGAMSLRRPL